MKGKHCLIAGQTDADRLWYWVVHTFQFPHSDFKISIYSVMTMSVDRDKDC